MVYLGAQAEASQVEMQSALDGLRVRDAMMTRFRTLSAGDTLGKAVEELLAGSQHDFPVLSDGDFVGVLRRDDLIRALADGNRDSAVGDVMSRECDPVSEADVLTPTLEKMTRNQCPIAPVMVGGRIVGLLTLENISELVMVNTSLHRPPPPLAAEGPVR